MLIDRGKEWCDSFIQHCILQGNIYTYTLMIDKDSVPTNYLHISINLFTQNIFESQM